MDFQFLLNVALSIIGTISGWLFKVLWDAIVDLRKADDALIDKVAKIEIMVAGSYVTRDEFQKTVTAMFAKLDRIEDKIGQKADR